MPQAENRTPNRPAAGSLRAISTLAVVIGIAIGAIGCGTNTPSNTPSGNEHAAPLAVGTAEPSRGDRRSNQQELEFKDRENALLGKDAVRLDVIPGDGEFVVGKDVVPGTYRSAGSSGHGTGVCQYSVKNSADADAHIQETITKGPATVILRNGQIFKTKACSDWTLQ